MSVYIVVTIIALGVVSIVFCNPIHNQSNGNDVYFRMSGIFKLEKHQSIRVCHEAMPTLMQQLCEHGYNKRSFNTDDQNDENISPSLAQSPSNGMENLLRNMLTQNSERFYRSSRSLHNDCCVKTCTLSKLMTYCSQPSTVGPVMTSGSE